MLKILKMVLAASIFSLASCGTTENSKEEKAETEEAGKEAPSGEMDFSTAAPGEWQESSNGSYRLMSYGYSEEIGLDFSDNPFVPIEVGPMGITVQHLSVIDYKPGEAQKRVVFGDVDQVRIISAYLVIDNYSDTEILFNPDEAMLITNIGESLAPLKHWTWTIDGRFTAGATKAVSIAWALEDIESELDSVRIAFAPPVSNATNEALSEPVEIEIEILPY